MKIVVDWPTDVEPYHLDTDTDEKIGGVSPSESFEDRGSTLTDDGRYAVVSIGGEQECR